MAPIKLMRSFRFGIEEEYFVVGRRTANVRCRLPKQFMRAAKRKLGPNLMYEMLQSQIEAATTPVTCSRDARAQLRHFRSVLAEVGKDHNVGIVAAGSHPLAMPHQQRMTRKRRYTKLIDDLGLVGLGNPLCGLHVHVEVPEPDRRVDIMHRLVPFLPLLLALSTSSPFWAGCETGLLGYRSAANDMLPRSGLPEMFQSLAEYETYVQALVEAGIIPDSTYVWWALRPSLNNPTLELRITDCCTSVNDAVAIAALYRALVRHLFFRPTVNAGISPLSRALAEENRWCAQRYGIEGSYLDEATRETMSFKALLTRTIAALEDEIAALGIEKDISQLLLIEQRGTSAHHQLRRYHSLRRSGQRHKQAMQGVCKWLRESTEAGELLVTNAPSDRHREERADEPPIDLQPMRDDTPSKKTPAKAGARSLSEQGG